MYRYSLEERVFIVKTYWITGSIKNCQRRFVEQFGGKQAPSISLHDWLTTRAASSWLSYLIFSCCQLPFCKFPKHTTALHYKYGIQIYCTFVLFVNQHFPGLPASGTHCTSTLCYSYDWASTNDIIIVTSKWLQLRFNWLNVLCKAGFIVVGWLWSRQDF
jgi:hypothetical protein